MSARSMLLAVTALAVTIAGCRYQAPEAAPVSDEDVAAIGQIRSAYVEATLRGDWAGVAALYEEEGVRMPPNQPIDQGRAAVQAALEATPGTVTDVTVTGVELEGSGGLAYDRGTYSITIEIEGRPLTDRGKYVAVSRKQPDGSWLLTALIWNSDQPPPGTTP